MSIFASGYGDLTPVALMNLGSSIGQGEQQGVVAGASMALRNYQAESLANFHSGQNSARLAMAGARAYAAQLGLEGKMGATELNTRSQLAGDFIAHASDLGQTFDPATVKSIYDQAFSAPISDLMQGGIRMPGSASTPAAPTAPVAPPAPGSGAPVSNMAASLGDAPPSGPGGPPTAPTPASATFSPPPGSPPAAAAGPTFAPSSAVVAKTGLVGAQTGLATAQAAAANANTLKTVADVTGPTQFYTAVSAQPPAQQRSFIAAYNTTHGTSYVMPGERDGNGAIVPYYDQNVQLQAALKKTTAQIASLTAGTAKTNAETTDIPLDDASLRTYRALMGQAATSNAASSAQNANTNAANAMTAAYRATHPPTDSFTTQAYAQLDHLDNIIAGANQRKNAAILSKTQNPAGKQAIMKAEDANIQAVQAQQAKLQGAIEAHQATLGGNATAGPTSPGSTGNFVAPAPILGRGGLGVVGPDGTPLRALPPPGRGVPGGTFVPRGSGPLPRSQGNFQPPPGRTSAAPQWGPVGPDGFQVLTTSKNGDELQYRPANRQYYVNGQPTGRYAK